MLPVFGVSVVFFFFNAVEKNSAAAAPIKNKKKCSLVGLTIVCMNEL